MSLPGPLEKVLKDIVNTSNLRGACLRTILLSTSDGAPLGRVVTEGSSLDEEVLLNLESAWSPPNKSLGMLSMGKVHQITATYNHGTVIHVYQAPIVITILCEPNANLGAVRSTTIPAVKQAVEPLTKQLVNFLLHPEDSLPPAFFQ